MKNAPRRKRKKLARTSSMSFLGFGLVLYAGLFPGCGSTEERNRALKLGANCTLDSECDPHRCIFERCHQQCDTDFDCPDEQRCVKGSGDVNVCQLPDERDCDGDSDCDAAQECAEDGQCRDACDDADDCVFGQLCTQTGVCVSPERDRLDDDGELITGGSGTGGSGGSSGEAGRGGTDAGGEGGNDAGGTSSGTGGTGGMGGTSDAGEGGEAGTSGAAGNGGGAGVGGSAGGMAGAAGTAGAAGMAGGGMSGMAGMAGAAGTAGAAGMAGAAGAGGSSPVSEQEPNDSLDAPGALPINRDLNGTINPPTEYDYFEFAAPSGAPLNGYFTWTLTDVGPSAPTVHLYSTVDNNVIYQQEVRVAGASLFGFLGTLAGMRYRIRIGRWAGGAGVPFDYVLRADYHPVPDTHEPNDTRLEASDIALGVDVSAYMVAGFESSLVTAADFDDWYAFTTDAGQIQVEVSAVPNNVVIYLRVHDTTGAGVGVPVSTTDPGATVLPFTRTLTTSGRHFLRISYDSTVPQTGNTTDTPGDVHDHFTTPYVFKVSAL